MSRTIKYRADSVIIENIKEQEGVSNTMNQRQDSTAAMRVPRFNEEHKAFIAGHIARGTRYAFIAEWMQIEFVEFEAIDKGIFKETVVGRIKYYKNDKRSTMYQNIRRLQAESEPDSTDLTDIPVYHLRYRLEALQQMLNEWEPRTWLRIQILRDGTEVPIYRDNTANGIAILREVRELLSKHEDDSNDDSISELLMDSPDIVDTDSPVDDAQDTDYADMSQRTGRKENGNRAVL